MDVEVRILSAVVAVQQTQPCYVKWMRQTQSINTGKKNVTVEDSKVTFDKKSATFKIVCSFFKNSETDVWREDKNSLTLFIGTEAVGKCDFDMPRYIDKIPKYETASIVGESHQAGEDERVLKGNVEKFPGS